MGHVSRSRGWKETQVRLRAVTVTTFDGPDDDFLIVIHGKRRPPKERKRKSKQNSHRN